MKDVHNKTTYLKGARAFYLGMCREDRSLSPPTGPGEARVTGAYLAVSHLADGSTTTISATPVATWRYEVASSSPKHPGKNVAPRAVTERDKARVAADFLADLAERAIAAAQAEASL